MKVVSININGIRSGFNKGFFDWVQEEAPDVVCMQEVRAEPAQLEEAIVRPHGYSSYFNCAAKKGYSGVAIYTRRQPERVCGIADWDMASREGRFIQADLGALSVISLYLPSGSSGSERQTLKYGFMQRFAAELRRMQQEEREYIICGDWNIAHKNADIRNWRANRKNSGFLPEERAWLDTVFGDIGMVDAFRVLNQEPDQYTWWSNRGRARENNVGWRIDYQVITPGLKDRLAAVSVYTDQRFSDHAPLVMEYDL